MFLPEVYRGNFADFLPFAQKHPAAVESGGGSDGSFAAALGRPTLDGLGPICFDSCSRRARILIDSLFDRAAILAALIADLPNLDLATPKGARPWA